MELETFKSKINDKHKLIFGIIGVIASIIFFKIENNVILVIIIPCLMLIVPTAKTRNNKTVGKFLMVVLTIAVFTTFVSLIYDITLGTNLKSYIDIPLLYKSYILQIILRIYAIFCSFLLTIPTKIK